MVGNAGIGQVERSSDPRRYTVLCLGTGFGLSRSSGLVSDPGPKGEDDETL